MGGWGVRCFVVEQRRRHPKGWDWELGSFVASKPAAAEKEITERRESNHQWQQRQAGVLPTELCWLPVEMFADNNAIASTLKPSRLSDFAPSAHSFGPPSLAWGSLTLRFQDPLARSGDPSLAQGCAKKVEAILHSIKSRLRAQWCAKDENNNYEFSIHRPGLAPQVKI